MVRFDDEDTPSQEELAELKEMLDLIGESETRIKQMLRMAALDRDVYDSFVEMYQPQVERIEGRDTYYDWDYPFESYDGEFRLGTNPDGQPVGLTREELNEHMMIVGRSGAGKTTLFYNLMDECAGQNLPFWAFDLKNDYRPLAGHRDLLVVNWRDLKFNPLQPPPSISPEQWGEILVPTFAHNMSLLDGSEGYVLGKLEELYTFYDTAAGQYPSLFELRELAADEKISQYSPRFKYRERLVNRLVRFTGFSGVVFDCSRGYPIEELLDRNVVFELKGVNSDVATFVVEMLLTWLFYYRDAQGHRKGLRHCVLFDEAKRVFDVNREKQPESGIPPVSDLMGKVREFGEALIVADHEPSKLSDSLKANTNAKLWMSLGSGKDTEEMRRTFGVDREETDYTRTLEKGEALLKLADRDPVPVELPDYQLEKSVTAAEIRERMRPELESLSWSERVRPREFLREVASLDTSDADPELEQDDTGKEMAIGEVAEQLLVSVTEEEFLSMQDRYDLIGVVTRQGTEAKEELLDQGLVQEEVVRNGKRGRNPKMLELTDAGRTLLEEQGYDVAPTGRRGIEHRYWQNRVKQCYVSEGFDVEIEFSVGKQAIDVYCSRGDTAVAVEVACSPEHEVENIRKCLEFGVDRVEVIYLEIGVRERIESAVSDVFEGVPDRVQFVSVSEYA